MAITKTTTAAAGTSAAKPATTRPAVKSAPASSAAAPTNNYASLDPDSFTAGGLIDDIDVTFTDALACEFDYGGQGPAGPSLAIEMTDPNGTAHVQYYSAGKIEDWKPSDNGEGFVPVSGKAGFNNSTNIAMFMASLIAADPRVKGLIADGNVKHLIGIKAHVLQKATERKGLIRTGRNADRPSSVLLVTKVIALPGDEGAVQGKPVASVQGKPNGAAAGVAPATEAAIEGDLDTTIIGALSEALAVADGGAIAKKDIAKVVFKAYTDAGNIKQRNAAIVRSGQQEFLKSLAEWGVQYDGTSISLASSAEGAVQ